MPRHPGRPPGRDLAAEAVLVAVRRDRWGPLAEGFGLDVRTGAGPNVEAFARTNGTTWVFTVRPEGRALQPFVEEVVAGL